MTSPFRRQRGKQSYRAGQWAEYGAALFLILKGYRILGLRIKTPLGEIDILAAKGKILVVVEVKKRSDAFSAAAAISPHQQQRLQGAARFAQQKHPRYTDMRFDAMLFAPKSLPKHIKNAFPAQSR